MEHFDIKSDSERLTVVRSAPAGRMAFGFLLLFFTLTCLTPLGVLGAMQAGSVQSSNPLQAGSDPIGFADPHANHFGFLWLVGVGMVVVAMPIYAAMIYRAGTTYCFDRRSRKFTRNGRIVAPLRRVEAVHIHRTEDADDREIFRLAVVHSDGFKTPLDESYDEAEVRVVARLIADWVGVPITGHRGVDEMVEQAVPRDLRRGM